MAVTLADIVQGARFILQDEDGTAYRNTDGELTALYNEGLRELWRLRPDLFIGKFSTAIPTKAYTAGLDLTTVPFPVADSVYSPMVDFVVGRCELSNDEFAVDGRAVLMLKGFINELMT